MAKRKKRKGKKGQLSTLKNRSARKKGKKAKSKTKSLGFLSNFIGNPFSKAKPKKKSNKNKKKGRIIARGPGKKGAKGTVIRATRRPLKATIIKSVPAIARIAFRPAKVKVNRPKCLPKVYTLQAPKRKHKVNRIDTSDDALDKFSDLRIENNRFVPEGSSRGVSTVRPDILTLFDFSPLYAGNPSEKTLSLSGKLIELKYQSSYLHKETVSELVTNIRDAFSASDDEVDATDPGSPERILRSVDSRQKSNLKNLDNILDFELQTIVALKNLRDGFNIRNYPEASYANRTIQSFYKSFMGYTDTKQFESFTNTKLYFQLLIDLRHILEDYSFNLLSLVDSDRADDYSPVDLDNTYTVSDSFSFKIKNLSNIRGNRPSATDSRVFNSFLSSLPPDSTRRLRILLNGLSKELRVSSMLGEKRVAATLEKTFGSSNQGNPFDNIIGVPKNNIFTEPEGAPGGVSLANLGFIPTDLNVGNNKQTFVLPFENKYIEMKVGRQRRSFIPGNSYFVDSILHTKEDSLNLEPLNNYLQNYSKVSNDAISIIGRLLGTELDDQSVLRSEYLYKWLLSTYRNFVASGLVKTDDSLNSWHKPQLFFLALLRNANKNTNRKLKSMIFEYVLIAGLDLYKRDPSVGGEFWKNLAAEYKDLRNFPTMKAILGNKKSLDSLTKVESVDLTSSKSHGWAVELLSEQIEALFVNTMFKNSNAGGGSRGKLANRNVSFGSAGSNTFASEVAQRNVRNNFSNSSEEAFIMFDGDIKAALDHTKNDFVSSFVSFTKELTKAGDAVSVTSFFTDDGSGRTRQNFLNTSTVSLMLFEAYSSFAERFSDIRLDSVRTTKAVKVIWDKEVNDAISTAIGYIGSEYIDKSTDSLKVFRRRVGFQSRDQSSVRSAAKFNSPGKSTSKSKGPRTAFGLRLLKMGGLSNKYKPSVGNKGKSIKSNSLKKAIESSRKLTAATRVSKEQIGLLSFVHDSELQKKVATALGGRVVLDQNTLKLITELNTNKLKIMQEDAIVSWALNILETIETKMNSSAQTLSRRFSKSAIDETLVSLSTHKLKDPKSGNTLAGTSPNQFLYPYTIGDIKNIDDVQQTILNRYIGFSFNERLTNVSRNKPYGGKENAVITNIVDRDVRLALYSYLSGAEFTSKEQAATRIKLLSVGIPAGFRQYLTDKVFYSARRTRGDFTSSKENDLVNVKVFKREMRLDDLVFKPQTFLFDLSLFATPGGIIAAKPTIQTAFNKIIEKSWLVDFSQDDTYWGTTFPRRVSLNPIPGFGNYSKSLKELSSYDFITARDKQELFENHIQSFLIETYVNLASGLAVNEEAFADASFSLRKNENAARVGVNTARFKTFDQKFEFLIASYLREVLGEEIPSDVSFEDLLDSENITDTAKNTIRTIMLGKETWGAGHARERILNRKPFERIFHLPINVDKFEIDEKETNDTESGRRFLVMARKQGVVIEKDGGLFLKRNDRDVLFEDLFVVVENLKS